MKRHDLRTFFAHDFTMSRGLKDLIWDVCLLFQNLLSLENENGDGMDRQVELGSDFHDSEELLESLPCARMVMDVFAINEATVDDMLCELFAYSIYHLRQYIYLIILI
jgi:hypothetical protein